jgi:hypothetical protein
MALKKKFECVAVTGDYKDRDGNNKKRYLNIGSIFEREDGSICQKIDALPLGTDWLINGWVNFYPPKDDNQPRQQPRQQTPQPQTQNQDQSYDQNDDIPF